MDPLASGIFVILLAAGSISIYLVFKYGIKKKTYEEAVAEQRKQTTALLGSKPKPKEKKKKDEKKKAAKKANKEKSPAGESDVADDVSVDSKEEVNVKVPKTGKAKPTKPHVEFKPEPEEVPVETEVKEVLNKKRVKKVRPILVKKDSLQEIVLPIGEETPQMNHFEESLPKDEFERLRANSKEDIHTPDEKKPEKPSKKNKQAKTELPVEQNVVVEETNVVKEKKDEKVENAVVVQVPEPAINTGKEKKKKKSEFNSRQQMTAERDQLMNTIRNAELSRIEVQLLIDLLLNKQLEAPAVLNDWSEGKSDPVQKLKKQLADKEKQLADEQEALAGVQAKLKEVRAEQIAEKSLLQQKVRLAEESKVEIVAANNRLQQKLQELEEYRSREQASFQRLVEDNNALQMQRAALESTVKSLQEAEALLFNLKAENGHLTNELQRLTQEMTNYQNCVAMNQALQDKLEYAKGLERNHAFALTAQQEETKNLVDQLHRATEAHQIEEQKFKEIIAQLKLENQQLQEEHKMQMNGQSENRSKEHEVKVLNLTNELTSMKSQLTSTNQSLLDAEKRYHSDVATSQQKYEQVVAELEDQKAKNDELRKKNWKVMEALKAAESRTKPVNVEQIAAEISREKSAQKEFIQRLFPEIEGLQTVSSDEWHSEFERLIRQHISQLQKLAEVSAAPADSGEVKKLQNEVLHYKKIIDETESTLKKLEFHIQQEERYWRNEIAKKESEIEVLRSQSILQLESKVSTLEAQLAKEQADKQRLLEERQQSITRPEIKSVHVNSTATIEKLSEELDHLKELLRLEQSKNKEAVYQNGETS